MSINKELYIASGYLDSAVRDKRCVSEMTTHLEGVLGDEITLLHKGDHQEYWMVYDDSRPSQLVYTLPKGYK